LDVPNTDVLSEQKSIWDVFFVFSNLCFFLIFANVAFLYLYPIALRAMGGEPHTIGLVMGIFSAATVVSRPLMGKLVVLKGERRVLSLGMATCLVSSGSYAGVEDLGPAVLLIRVVHGVGFSAVIASGFSLMAKSFRPSR